MRISMRITYSTIAVALVLSTGACSNMSQTQQRTLSGAGIGAVGGTAIGAIAGNAGLGAAIGAVAGAGGGYIYDQHKKSEERAYSSGYSAGQKSR
jgi:hypothetical protein